MTLFYPLVLFNKLLFRTPFFSLFSGEVQNLITHNKITNYKGHAPGINYFIKPQDLQIDQLVKDLHTLHLQILVCK